MNLIDRIEAKRKVVDYNDLDITHVRDIAYNEAIDDVIAMPEIFALSIALTDEQLDKLKAIHEASGILKELTTEQLAQFEEAIKRG